MTNDYATIISIFAKVIMLTLVLPVLPIMWKESQVPNGLGLLRRLIFASIGSFILANIGVLFFQFMRLFISVDQVVFDLASMINSCATIIIGIVLNIIYSGRYRKHETG